MWRLHLIARAACVFPFLAAQVYLIVTYGVLPGYATILMWQVGLQVGAALVAPAGFRWWAAIAGAWLAVIVGLAMFLALFTLVAPFGLIMAMSQGEFSGLWGVLGALAYLVASAGVVLCAFLFDQT